MRLINAVDHAEEMKTRVLPFLEKRREAGYSERKPGQKLYFEHYRTDDPKATVVILHGFTESIGKFYETAYYFLTSGFHVWMLQQRGHGKSFRGTQDPALVKIEHYEDLILDLHHFVTEQVKKAVDTERYPLYLFGHSMGGGVSGCYLERYPGVFEKAVLSSPMMELNSGGTPAWLAASYAALMKLLKKGEKYMPGSTPFSGEPDFANSCSNCEERYNYWFEVIKAHPEYQMSCSAITTALELLKLTREVTAKKNCRRVRTKVLLIQAGKDTMVKSGGQDAFIRGIGEWGKKIVLPEAKHEIYFGQDKDLQIYWDQILDFLK